MPHIEQRVADRHVANRVVNRLAFQSMYDYRMSQPHKSTPGYREMILEATGCKPEEAGLVESIMRVMHGGLEELNHLSFGISAKAAYEVLMKDKHDGAPEAAFQEGW